MGYAFISYSAAQQKDADRLRLLLHANDINTWMAPYDIPEGADYAELINNAIKNAACFVLLLTKDTQDSAYVDKEVERALHYGKTIAPIQLEIVDLNDSFSFYLCNQQIVTVPAIDASLPKMQSLLQHLQFLCNDKLPSKQAAPDAAKDKRVKRQKIARLFIWLGVVLLCLCPLCSEQYVNMISYVTWQEMYEVEDIPSLSVLMRSYGIFFALACAGLFAFLYGCSLKNPQKKTWHPLRVLSTRYILPSFSVLCGAGFITLHYAQQAIDNIIYRFEIYRSPTDGYILPSWMAPASSALAVVSIATALLSLVLAIIHDKRNGFAFVKSLRDKFLKLAANRKKGG